MAIVKQITLKADTSTAVKDVKKLNKEVAETGKEVKKTGTGLKGAFAGFSDALTGAIPLLGRLKTALISTGVGALVVAFGSLVALFKEAGELGNDFAKALSALEAVSGRSSEELATLTQQAKDLGASTAFTAIQVVELQTELAKLGFTVQEIENSTPAILGLASSLEVDLASAAALAGSTVRAFGLDTLETQRVVDTLALSTSKSALDFESLTESLKIVAPTSRATGVSIEETTALLGVLADSGLKGSIAGTGLAKTFIELNKKGLTLEQGLEKVNNSSNKLNTSIELVGIVGSKSLLNLAGSAEKIPGLTETLNNAEGAAKRMSEIRLDNVAGDLVKLGSAWDGFLLGLDGGEGIITKLQRVTIQALTASINFLGDAIDFTRFLFNDFFDSVQLGISATRDIIGGGFSYFTSVIKKFANQAILLISEIPYIGKAIDAQQIESNLLVAEEELEKSQERIQRGLLKSNQLTVKTNTFFQRFQASQEIKEKEIANKKLKEQDEQFALEDLEAKKLAEEQRLKELEAQEEARLKLLAKFKKKEEDLLADSAFKKLELDKERNFAEIEALGLSKEQENALKLAYEASYAIQRKKLIDKEREEFLQGEDAYNKDRIKSEEDLQNAREQIRKMNFASARMGLRSLSSNLREGTKLQKISALADITLGTATGFMNGLKIAQQGAAGTGPLAPFTYPIFAATQIAAVIGAASKAKSILAGVKGGGGVGSTVTAPRMSGTPSSTAPSVTSEAPSFNIVGQSSASQIAEAISGQPPVKAFVVANDVTTAQGLERNIIEGATLGD